MRLRRLIGLPSTRINRWSTPARPLGSARCPLPATNSPSTDGDAAQAGGTDRESIGHQYRLGVDIGGTFTDATLIDEGTGAVYVSKSATTPKNLVLGFKKAARAVMRKASIMPCDIRYLVHATTVATNSIIEGQVATTAFITTSGFRDLLEIARQVRPTLYDLMFEKPRPLVPRDMCFEVTGRLDASGRVLVPLKEEEIRQTRGAGQRSRGGGHRRMFSPFLLEPGSRNAGLPRYWRQSYPKCEFHFRRASRRRFANTYEQVRR